VFVTKGNSTLEKLLGRQKNRQILGLAGFLLAKNRGFEQPNAHVLTRQPRPYWGHEDCFSSTICRWNAQENPSWDF